jgi:hypothetical protein
LYGCFKKYISLCGEHFGATFFYLDDKVELHTEEFFALPDKKDALLNENFSFLQNFWRKKIIDAQFWGIKYKFEGLNTKVIQTEMFVFKERCPTHQPINEHICTQKVLNSGHKSRKYCEKTRS